MSFDYGKYFGEIKLTHDLLSEEGRAHVAAQAARATASATTWSCTWAATCSGPRTWSRQWRPCSTDSGLDYVARAGPTYCCGIQHHRRGQEASGERYANHTVELLQSMAPREVVMWCPSCIQFYDEVLQADLPFPEATHRRISSRTVWTAGLFTFTRRVEATVALHYHRATRGPGTEGARPPPAAGSGARHHPRRVRGGCPMGADVHAGSSGAARTRSLAPDGL
jgi:hypothetical protein